jgi:Na+-translocating ferredoxin:NAD+ oxidoreductase RnfA subunit
VTVTVTVTVGMPVGAGMPVGVCVCVSVSASVGVGVNKDVVAAAVVAAADSCFFIFYSSFLLPFPSRFLCLLAHTITHVSYISILIINKYIPLLLPKLDIPIQLQIQLIPRLTLIRSNVHRCSLKIITITI